MDIYNFRKNAAWVFSAEPVKQLDGSEFSKSDVDLITQVARFFDSIGGKVKREKLGYVELTRRGVKDSIAHGIGRVKATAFMAVPEVIKHGKVIDYQANWKGRGYNTYIIDAPISIGKAVYIAEVVIEQSPFGSNKFYLHEVELKEKAQSVFKTATERGTLRAPRLVITKKLTELGKSEGIWNETGLKSGSDPATGLP